MNKFLGLKKIKFVKDGILMILNLESHTPAEKKRIYLDLLKDGIEIEDIFQNDIDQERLEKKLKEIAADLKAHNTTIF